MKVRMKKLKDMKRKNCTHLGIWTISAAVLLGAVFAASTTVAQTIPDEGYPIMRPDPGTLKRWLDSYHAAPAIGMADSEMVAPAALGQHSVLPHVPYVPVDRDQGGCGNCWIWAGTGCMEVAHHVKNGVFDRLSIQYLHSNYSGPKYACCGGSLSDVQGFYAGTGIAIPWSNTNANWQDWITDCPSGSTTVPGASIATVPQYGIHHINRNSITTQTVNQATAIANIKSVLDNDDGVWFGFFLPNKTAWTAFFNFWDFQPETAVWDDWYSGTPYDPSDGEGGGHAVLCVGYDDMDPGNSYWIMLNSWGTAGVNRPNGLFRVDMDMD
ncbi:C1 family peptidase, partial [Planctomycetota bacterium]